jgi:hypothetical protein
MSKRNYQQLSDQDRSELQQRIKNASNDDVARQLSVSPATLKRALAGKLLRRASAEKLRSSPRVREASDFDGGVTLESPRRIKGAVSPGDSKDTALDWIRSARDAQFRGEFRTPAQLARIMLSDDAIYTAYHNRVSPQLVLSSRLASALRPKRASIASHRAACCSASRGHASCTAWA